MARGLRGEDFLLQRFLTDRWRANEFIVHVVVAHGCSVQKVENALARQQTRDEYHGEPLAWARQTRLTNRDAYAAANVSGLRRQLRQRLLEGLEVALILKQQALTKPRRR